MDQAEFKRASHAVWDAMAPAWSERHAYFERVARPVTERMLERAQPSAGHTVLDLAAGTGVVGFAAAALVGAEGRVLIADFSEVMVAAAQQRAEQLGMANVDCRVLDAEQLDLPDASVDRVLCRWGYMLMGAPDQALAETRRVLRPDGRLAFAVFAGPEANPWVALPNAVLQERGHMPPPGSGGPGILALADRERLASLVVDAGFAAPELEDIAFAWEFDSEPDFWEFLTDAAGGIAMVLGRLDDGERAKVRAAIAERVDRSAESGAITLAATSIVASTSPAT